MSSVLRNGRKWWRLGRPRRGHALAALAWLVASHLALRLWPYSTVRRMIPKVPAGRASGLTSVECEAALRRAASVFPRSSCLARAIAAACLLRRARRGAVLTIGVGLKSGPQAQRDLQAHAWLESDGTIVTGGQEIGPYETLLEDAIPAPQ